MTTVSDEAVEPISAATLLDQLRNWRKRELGQNEALWEAQLFDSLERRLAFDAAARGVDRATATMTNDDLVDELHFIVREREQRPEDFDEEITATIAIAADRVEALTLVVEDCLDALKGMLRHSCVADAHPEDKDSEDHVAERTARHAISKAEGWAAS